MLAVKQCEDQTGQFQRDSTVHPSLGRVIAVLRLDNNLFVSWTRLALRDANESRFLVAKFSLFSLVHISM
jgi:hypothetical protein